MDFDVDPEQLRTHGGAIADTGTGAAGELSRLHDQIVDHGAPWGTDSAGAALAAAYRELTALTSEALGLITEGFTESGTRVRNMADTYEHPDHDAGDIFRRLGGGA